MQPAHASLDPFDRTEGNGSNGRADDFLDGDSIFDNEWGSTAATTFKPSDCDDPARRRKLERLYKLQNGKFEDTRIQTIRASNVENDAQTFMSVLELAEPQRDRIMEVLDDLDISSNNFGGRRYEKIILAICSLIADESLSNQPDPSLDDRLFLSDEFQNLMDVCNMTNSEHRKLRASVRDKSSYFD
jgi:hypothetical protein